MAWKFKGEGLPLPGIGAGPFTDEEFEIAVSVYEAQFSDDQKGAVKASGLYERTSLEKVADELPDTPPPVVAEAKADEQPRRRGGRTE
ncbi:MAG TPA: hypothetical protein VEA63_07010 [Opitutus sp.]|nr:hypothetical protein [Opitutus sp.]